MRDPDHRRLMCPPTRHYSCFFFCFFFCFFCVCFSRDDVRWSPNKIKAHKKVPKHAWLKLALSKCTYRFNKTNRLMTIVISRVINLFSIFVFDIGFHVITVWVNFCDVGSDINSWLVVSAERHEYWGQKAWKVSGATVKLRITARDLI